MRCKQVTTKQVATAADVGMLNSSMKAV